MADTIRIRTIDGREHDVTQAQWDLIYSGDGSTVVEAYKPGPAKPEPKADDAKTDELETDSPAKKP